jgi:hypothetical protein
MTGEAVASALVTAFTTIVAVASPDRVPREGGFAITAITEEDLAVPVSPRTTLKWPKV